jgi:hypothetical protein
VLSKITKIGYYLKKMPGEVPLTLGSNEKKLLLAQGKKKIGPP